jgi:hypothetical protein
MRFGRRSHTPDDLDQQTTTDRGRLIRTLRNLADTIEAAPAERVDAGLAGMVAAAETLVRAVERALGRT